MYVANLLHQETQGHGPPFLVLFLCSVKEGAKDTLHGAPEC